METIVSNLRVIEKKIKEAQERGEEETALAWKEQAGIECDKLRTHFAELGKPRTVMQQLYRNGLELP